MTETITPAETDNLWFADCLSRRPTKRRNIDIPEYAETTVIPTGMYRGVIYRNDRAPYMIRPLQCLSPQSNIQEVRCMFPAQTGKSTIGELATMYYIEVIPSEILAVTSDETQAAKWLAKRITPRAIKAGIIFRAQTESNSSRRTGNTTYSKEFDGGNLDVASARSPAQLASETKRLVIADETDRWKLSLGDEGATWEIMYARTQAWGDQKKILAISTPTLYDTSLIWILFEEGTREEYFVPCPLCGKFQLLKISNGTSGLTWETKAGRIIKNYVYYICDFCHDAFFESKKHEILNGGRWEAQAEPLADCIVSFHINAIYSPFKDWIEIAREYEKAKVKPDKMQTFNNLVMGMPHRETGSRPKVSQIIQHRGAYKSGQAPNGVLWVTGFIDVQRGKKLFEQLSDEDLEITISDMQKKKIDPHHQGLPRLELEIVGHGHGYRSYGIEYKVIYGHTHDANSGAWQKLREWLEETNLEYKRLDGSVVACQLLFVDSGDGERVNAVYQFCEPYPGIFPSKGDSWEEKKITDKKQNDKGDRFKSSSFKPYTLSKIGEGQYLYTISTNFYKSKVYQSLKIDRVQAEEQRPGFAEFPRDYPDYYFKMLTAEERWLDGSFHSGGRRNEALDCRAGALCARDVWLDNEVSKIREELVKKGMPREKAKRAYTYTSHIEVLKRRRANS